MKYSIVYSFFYLYSLLPYRFIYILSDIFYVLIYHGIGYRKKVVRENLKNSFPEKSEGELRAIEKKYYKHMSDLFLETFKMLSMSEKVAKKRVNYVNAEVLQDLYDRKKSVVMTSGHFGNWEWAIAGFCTTHAHQLNTIYRPIKNKAFDKLTYKLRTRYGGIMTTMNDTVRSMINLRNELTVTALAADQAPPSGTAQWINFLHQDTPVFSGPGKLSKKFDCPVIHLSHTKPKRGYYEITIHVITETPKELDELDIIKKFYALLEKDIQKTPHLWLWSHRRWKHKRKNTSE